MKNNSYRNIVFIKGLIQVGLSHPVKKNVSIPFVYAFFPFE